MGTLFRPWTKGPVTRRGLVQGTDEQGGTEQRAHIHALHINMKYQGLVDPEDKPFGNVLPFEVQVKIMFWVAFTRWTRERRWCESSRGCPNAI